jgi:hypothetical protein
LRVEFKAATGAKLFYSFFFLMGLFVGIGFSIQNNIVENFSPETIAPVLFSLIFVVVG